MLLYFFIAAPTAGRSIFRLLARIGELPAYVVRRWLPPARPGPVPFSAVLSCVCLASGKKRVTDIENVEAFFFKQHSYLPSDFADMIRALAERGWVSDEAGKIKVAAEALSKYSH